MKHKYCGSGVYSSIFKFQSTFELYRIWLVFVFKIFLLGMPWCFDTLHIDMQPLKFFTILFLGDIFSTWNLFHIMQNTTKMNISKHKEFTLIKKNIIGVLFGRSMILPPSQWKWDVSWIYSLKQRKYKTNVACFLQLNIINILYFLQLLIIIWSMYIFLKYHNNLF